MLSNYYQDQETRIASPIDFSSLSAIADTLSRRENVRILLEGLKNLDSLIEKFDIPTWHALVEYIKIMPDGNIVFHLRNGCEEIVPLAEVR